MATEYKLSYTAEEIDERLGKVVRISDNVDSLQGNVSVMQGDVGSLQTDVGVLQTDVNSLNGNVDTLQTDVQKKAEFIQLTKAEYDTLNESGEINTNNVYMLTDVNEDEVELITVEDIDEICGVTI